MEIRATSPSYNGNLAAFDMARALAALAVLLAHGRSFLLLDLKDQPALPWVGRLFYGLSALGHQAVIVFFVVSGALVTRSIMALAASGRWSSRSYATARLTRLWIVLLPCLVLGGCLDTLGLRFGDTLVYAGHYGALRVAAPATPIRLDPLALAANLAFLQTIVAPPYGTNVPLWSLASEAWYYAGAFLVWSAWRERDRPLRAAGYLAALALVVVGVFTPDMRALAPTWIVGALLALDLPVRGRRVFHYLMLSRPRSGRVEALATSEAVAHPSKRPHSRALSAGFSNGLRPPEPQAGSAQDEVGGRANELTDSRGGRGEQPAPCAPCRLSVRVGALIGLATTVAASRWIAVQHQLAGDYAVAGATALCLSAWRDWRPHRSVVLRAVRCVANLSYSLYLSHFPLLALLAAVCLANRRLAFGPVSLLMLAAALALSLAYAAALWWCFERHTMRVRGWVDQWSPWHRHPERGSLGRQGEHAR